MCPVLAQVQGPDSLQRSQASLTLDSLNSFFTHEDSLHIFDMIDSLLRSEPVEEKSQLALRLGYNSNIAADNRTFDISKFGLSPGVSYYHKSGAYADLSGYWSQEYDPDYYLTVTSVGYMHTFKKWYSVLAEYSHYFYHQPSDSTISVPYTNNLGVSNYLDFKPFVVRLDYYYYFGDKSAHRIIPGVGLNLVKRNWLGLNRIAFYPSFNMMFGSEQTTVYYTTFLLLRARLGQPLSYTDTVFGIMNYGFSLPISIVKNNWTFLIGYAYNIPVPLPGEDLTLESSGYLSFSITRYFNFK